VARTCIKVPTVPCLGKLEKSQILYVNVQLTICGLKINYDVIF
jgi:hypothetical protein